MIDSKGAAGLRSTSEAQSFSTEEERRPEKQATCLRRPSGWELYGGRPLVAPLLSPRMQGQGRTGPDNSLEERENHLASQHRWGAGTQCSVGALSMRP